MITSEDLKNVFYSGYDVFSDWQLLDELENLIQEKAIDYVKGKISSKKDYFESIDQVKVIEGLGPQGKGHMALKEIAKRYLEKQGKKAFSEISFLGTHPDVVSGDKKMIIQCGTTNPSCILNLLTSQDVSFVGILPYPNDKQHLILHKFSRGKNFRKWQNWKWAKLRKIFRKAKG